MTKALKSIVIVGGGTAGWITAGIIASSIKKKYAPKSIKITLIESANVSPVGVGEGTWPTMRSTLANIGISESDFIQQCNVSLKQGTQFVGWKNGGNSDRYYHPFTLPKDFFNTNLAEHWMVNDYGMSFAELVSPQEIICEHYLSPKEVGSPEFKGACNYGYHLDAGLFAKFLRKHCVEKLGIIHVVDDVIGVIEQKFNHSIKSVKAKVHGEIEGELFIDCSGSRSILLGQHYEVPFISKNNELFINSALAAQVPYINDQDPINSTTISTAQSAGWIWDIGLKNRQGIGHVYASEYVSEDYATHELLTYIKGLGHAASAVNIKKLSFEPGHREIFWKENCIAVGLSSGFVEPLEASSLALVELSANAIAEGLPMSIEAMPHIAKQFNKTFLYRWERVIDFLKLHYALNKRTDSPFWKDNRDPLTIPDSLSLLIAHWKYQVPWHYNFDRIEVFPAASYQYILCGMGFKTSNINLTYSNKTKEIVCDLFNNNQKLTKNLLSALPSNRIFLNQK